MTRWGRGFFRLWLVLSAVWIGLVVYSVGPKSYKLQWLWRAPVIEIETPSGRVASFDLSKGQAELAAAITLELQQRQSDLQSLSDAELQKLGRQLPPGFVLDQPAPELLSKQRDEILNAINSGYQTEKEQAEYYWLFTAIPPLVLLGVGLSIAWILRGFRHADK
jgi:hypothetical protein